MRAARTELEAVVALLRRVARDAEHADAGEVRVDAPGDVRVLRVAGARLAGDLAGFESFREVGEVARGEAVLVVGVVEPLDLLLRRRLHLWVAHEVVVEAARAALADADDEEARRAEPLEAPAAAVGRRRHLFRRGPPDPLVVGEGLLRHCCCPVGLDRLCCGKNGFLLLQSVMESTQYLLQT